MEEENRHGRSISPERQTKKFRRTTSLPALERTPISSQGTSAPGGAQEVGRGVLRRSQSWTSGDIRLRTTQHGVPPRQSPPGGKFPETLAEMRSVSGQSPESDSATDKRSFSFSQPLLECFPEEGEELEAEEEVKESEAEKETGEDISSQTERPEGSLPSTVPRRERGRRALVRRDPFIGGRFGENVDAPTSYQLGQAYAHSKAGQLAQWSFDQRRNTEDNRDVDGKQLVFTDCKRPACHAPTRKLCESSPALSANGESRQTSVAAATRGRLKWCR